MMDAQTYDVYVVVDLFLLLLIGIGPKIALLPYLELAAGMDAHMTKPVDVDVLMEQIAKARPKPQS